MYNCDAEGGKLRYAGGLTKRTRLLPVVVLDTKYTPLASMAMGEKSPMWMLTCSMRQMNMYKEE